MSRALNDGAAPDADLVRAARAGDMEAYETLYLRYRRVVHGILLARMPAMEVEDVVQDVFLVALGKLGRLREPASFAGWLATIARNRAMDFHRSSVPVAELDFEPEAPRADPASAVAVLGVIRGLPEAYRETLILRLVEGLTGPEIAERTGLTHGSVRVNLSRGMQRLRNALGERSLP